MDRSDEIKIRTVPRSNEKAAAEPKQPAKPTPEKKTRRWIIYVGSMSIILAGVFWLRAPGHADLQVLRAQGRMDLSSVNKRINDNVTRHLQDAEVKRNMMVQARELENLQFKDASREPNSYDVASLPDNRDYGVQLDSEDASDRVYEDLKGDPVEISDTLPDDRINARLAKRKWLNEQEREEKIQFISAYIRAAYERGYEVDIDKDLVVINVRKINKPKKVSIDQVIDRLAKQGY